MVSMVLQSCVPEEDARRGMDSHELTARVQPTPYHLHSLFFSRINSFSSLQKSKNYVKTKLPVIVCHDWLSLGENDRKIGLL